jgi:Carboxypeptidase regulatory-like domain/TonB-dependent Receptor Plug Domain
MNRKRYALGGFLCLAFVLAGTPVFGQGTGSLLGNVEDKTGAAMPGATVNATSQGTGVSRTTQTDDAGHFLLPLLPIGIYTLQVSAQGFQTVEEKDIKLQVDESREVNFSLSPAAVQQTVEVSGTAVAVETTNATLGQVITSQEVAQLPLNGRDFVQLATLAPGTTKETNPNSFFNGGGSSEVGIRGSFSLSVGGSRANSTDWLFDGVDNNEMTAGGIAILPNIDALQEFKVLTNSYSAEYGTRGGPAVLLTTKSGTNQFHGSVFEFLRNTNLNARNFFAPSTPEFIQNQFGGSLGGPIKKNKLFFFADYQGRRTAGGGLTYTATVPTLAMRTGDFSESFAGVAQLYNPFSTQMVGGQITRAPFMCDASGNPLPVNSNGLQAAGTACNKIPPSLFNPIAQQMINFYPAPNVPGTLFGNFVNTPTKQLKEGEFDFRLDWTISSKDSAFGRFSYDQATVFLPVGEAGFMNLDGFTSTQSLADHGRNLALSETHVFSSNSINKSTFGYNRIFNHILSYASGSCESQTLGVPGANIDCTPQGKCEVGGVSCGLTDTLIGGGFWNLGDRGFAPFQGGTNVFYIADSFDIIRGKHDVTFGGEIRANQMNVLTNAFQDGFWVFTNAWTSSVANGASTFVGGNNMADFLLGIPDLGLHDQTFQGPITGRRWKLYRPFVQDNVRLSPSLTLNLGLAWAIVPPITEVFDRQTNFNMQTGQFLIAGHNASSTVGLSTDWTAFEPRIGLSWTPGGQHNLAIRAGYGIFHDSSWNQGAQGLWENPPYFEESSSYPGFFPDLCPPSTATITPICASQPALGPVGKSISGGFPLLTQPNPNNPASFGGNLQTQNLNFGLGMIQQFNVNVERQLPGDVVLTVGYAGSRSIHMLEDGQNVNVASPTGCGTIPGYTFGCGIASAPWPQFGTISNAYNNGYARYDSLQVKAETKSGKHGLYMLLGYTYSKATDNGFSDGLGSNVGAMYYPLPNIGNADKALSQIDLAQNFTASVVYDLPFGKGKAYGNNWNGATNALFGNWQVNAIVHITSGFPIFMIASNDLSGVAFSNDGNNYNRPNRLCGGQLSNWTVNQYFNASCFVDPPAGELGNSSRTPLTGPGFSNTDFSLIKNFRLGERVQLQFRTEFFNIFNHPQFYSPINASSGQYADVDSVGFGKITETVNNPRLIQFALKLTF